MNESYSAKSQTLFARIEKPMLVVAGIALLTVVVEWGWGGAITPLASRAILLMNALVIALFVFEALARLVLSDNVRLHVAENTFEIAVTAVFLAALILGKVLYNIEGVAGRLVRIGLDLSLFYVLLGQLYLLVCVLMKAISLQKKVTAAGIRPAAVVMGSFAGVILLGTVLLVSPRAIAAERLAVEGRLPLVDALFTATSAVCVTGLIVRETGTHFSQFGQVVILVLIQIGGLGLMTFVTFSSLILGKGMALSEQVAMQDALSYDVLAKLPRLVVYILLVTFVTEAIGAALLYRVWHGDMSVQRRLYVSIFHSVSSFCNAGFSLFDDSFVAYRGSLLLNGVVTFLVIFGGLGFIVQRNLAGRLWYALRCRLAPHSRLLKPLRESRHRSFMSLQTKIVLAMTGCLLAAGAILFALLEWHGALGGLSLSEKLLGVWFQAVTPRTAGFNTVSFSSMRTTTYLMIVVLMFIGASPGGTGGGIKTSTFFILLATVYSALSQREDVEALRRRVPAQVARQAVMVMFLGLALVISGLFVLSITEPGVPFERLLFENMSAFGTVGLSTGTPGTPLSLSASLSWLGKLVIIVTMFAGRIGPLTLVIAIAQQRRRVQYEYPAEELVIG